MKKYILFLCLSTTVYSQSAVDIVARNDALMAAHPASVVTSVSPYELYLHDQRMNALRAQQAASAARFNTTMSNLHRQIQRDIKELERMAR
jgi:hypothetical protein